MIVSQEEIETKTGAEVEGSRTRNQGPGIKEAEPGIRNQTPIPDTRAPTSDSSPLSSPEAIEHEITRFSAAVAHELQQPLTVIRNAVYFLNMYMGERLDERVRKHMGMIWNAADVASNGVADLLCFAEHRTPVPTDADVGVLVLDARSRIRIPRRIRFRTVVHDTLPTIYVDPMQIVRVLANLVANALDSMPETGTLKIVGTANANEVVIEVADTGIGIPAADLPRVFDPFFTTKPDGKGLGLAIVQRLTKLNGGRVAIASEVGKGTTVTLAFPWRQKFNEIGPRISVPPETEHG